MPYRLNTGRVIARDITVVHPDDKGKTDASSTVTVHVKMIETTEYLDLLKLGYLALVARVLVSVEDLSDLDDKPIPLELSAQAGMADPLLVYAIHQDYFSVMTKKNTS